jgi:hypothetical protein
VARPDNLVRADVGGGRIIHVEARPATGDPETDVAIQNRFKATEAMPFDGVTDSIEAIAERVTNALSRVRPDKATVEFGIDVGVEAGGLTALLVKGTGTATLKVTLEWESSAKPAAATGGGRG